MGHHRIHRVGHSALRFALGPQSMQMTFRVRAYPTKRQHALFTSYLTHTRHEGWRIRRLSQVRHHANPYGASCACAAQHISTGHMTSTYLCDCMVVLGWNNAGLATQLGCREDVVRGWTQGVSLVPLSVERWLSARVDALALLPAPVLSQTGTGCARYLGPERRKLRS